MGGSPGRGPSQWCGSNLLQKGTKKGLSPIWDFLFRMILNALVVENESQCAGLYGRNTVMPKKHNEKHRCDGLRPASGGAKRRYGLFSRQAEPTTEKKKLVTSRAPRARVKCFGVRAADLRSAGSHTWVLPAAAPIAVADGGA